MHSLMKAIQAVPLFAGSDPGALLKLVGASTNLVWPRGAVVFEAGVPAQALYVVLLGKVRILDPGDGEEREVAELGAGEFFGELSLLEDRKHSKRAVVAEDAELLVVPKAFFQELIASDEQIAALFRRTAEERAGAPELSRLA